MASHEAGDTLLGPHTVLTVPGLSMVDNVPVSLGEDIEIWVVDTKQEWTKTAWLVLHRTVQSFLISRSTGELCSGVGVGCKFFKSGLLLCGRGGRGGGSSFIGAPKTKARGKAAEKAKRACL